jgi:hypothetical protein
MFEYQEEIYGQWEEDNQRRASGQPTELFQDQETAREWLKQIAPLKYVDGAWLGYCPQNQHSIRASRGNEKRSAGFVRGVGRWRAG